MMGSGWERPPEYDDPPEPPGEPEGIGDDEEEEDDDDCPYCEGDGCHECDDTGRYES